MVAPQGGSRAPASMAESRASSHVQGGALYLEALYEQFLADPGAVADEWRHYFETLPRVNGGLEMSIAAVRDNFLGLGNQRGLPRATARADWRQMQVAQLIDAHRHHGHLAARLDPLAADESAPVPELQLEFHRLGPADLDTDFSTDSLLIGTERAALREIVAALEAIYCGTLGVEYMHLAEAEQKRWFQQRLEPPRGLPTPDNEVRRLLMARLAAAGGLESYLGSRYPGTKRFGLEGGESLIPLVDGLLQRAGALGAREIVLGMAHRGRLNVLVNVLGKRPAELFAEFEGTGGQPADLEDLTGDVKYHQGFSCNVQTPGGEVHIALAFNPSHLEIVAPVVEGSVRARQDRRNDVDRDLVVPVVVHGDAAFAGQGVVMETLQMSATRGYRTGGTVHLVINNQIGFTTSRPDDARSTRYCTDVAKMVQAPILHVNGDDPEAVLFAGELAMDYRYRFHRDIVIDLVCYRRRGHNEADEPAATQPLMYQRIRAHRSVGDLYAERLAAEGVVQADEIETWRLEYRENLDRGAPVVQGLVSEPDEASFFNWKPYLQGDPAERPDTAVEQGRLRRLAEVVNHTPEGFVLQKQVANIYKDRDKMAAGALTLNWGFAETLAYASLLDEGYPIRITGQDVRRGTFSHRHLVLHNQKDGVGHIPLTDLVNDGNRFEVYDSLLSEEAVLGFEYGYATTWPSGLVIWEAQFGDFANGAQVVIDQFITSGEQKWARLCGLTLLLPHGCEGQGPEHSSARLERFLQLSARENVQICIPSTPAQIFHLLRRQAHRFSRRPLVVFTPKSLLRHKQAVSTLEDLSGGSFEPILDERANLDPGKWRRLVMCSGKLYYELAAARDRAGLDHVAIARFEQLYPFPYAEFEALLVGCPGVREILWCQEEPRNQGAWHPTRHRFLRVLDKLLPGVDLRVVARNPAAAPATGHLAVHLAEQEKLVGDAIGLDFEQMEL